MSFISETIPILLTDTEKNDIIKHNLVKMIYKRGFIKEENINKYKNKYLKDNEDNIYELILDNNENYNSSIPNKKIYILFYYSNISSINKDSVIMKFIAKYNDDYKIILINSLNTKIDKIIKSIENTEIFTFFNFIIDITEHMLVPKHIVLSKEEGISVLNAYCARKKDMPYLLSCDPIAKYYNMKPGDICKIIRTSTMTGLTPYYRIVVKSNSLKIKT